MMAARGGAMALAAWFVVVCGACWSVAANEGEQAIERTYPVADLVVPIPTGCWPGTASDERAAKVQQPHFQRLIEHLKKVTLPESWTEGKGEIKETPETLSLVVRQTSAIHERIVAELARLRRDQDRQITQALTVVTGPRNEIAALAKAFPGELGRFEQDELREALQQSAELTTKLGPKITAFNGQVATLGFEGKVLVTQAVVAEGRTVRIKVACAPVDRPMELVSSVQTPTLHEGRAVAIRFEAPPVSLVLPPADDAEECLVIVEPRIIVQEEEVVRNDSKAPQAAAPGTERESPRGQFDNLKEKYEQAKAAFREAYKSAETDEERNAAAKREPKRQEYVKQFFRIADAYPDDPAAIESLIWIATEDMYWRGGELALKTLTEKHAARPQVAEYLSRSRYGGTFAPYEKLLRAAFEQHRERETHARIGLTLAQYLKLSKEEQDEKSMVASAAKGGGFEREYVENLKRPKGAGASELSTEAEELLQTLIADYGDVKPKDSNRESVAEIARQVLYELRNLQIGNVAPDFEAKDIDGNPIRLKDLRGKVVVLDFGSHSGCGICRALYPELGRLVEQFQGQPFELIGINQGDEIEKLRELRRSKEVTWRLVHDGDEGWDGPISSVFAIDSMPTFYVIDHKGIIRGKNYFELFRIMPELIEKLLAERKADQGRRE